MPGHHHDDDQPAGDPEDQVLSLDLVGEIMTQGPQLYDPAILTDAVRSAIAQIWEIMPADKLVANRPGDIAFTLDEILTDAMGYTNDQRFAIAKELVRYIRLIREEPAPVAAEAPAPPAAAADDDAERAAEAELRRRATKLLTVPNLNGSRKKTICLQINVNGTNASARNVIVLEGGEVSGLNATAKVLCPWGVEVEATGMNAEVEVKHHTNVELLAIANAF